LKKRHYLEYILNPIELLRTKKVLHVNPTSEPVRKEVVNAIINIIEYDKDQITQGTLTSVEEACKYLHSSSNTWINVDGLKTNDVEKLCAHFNIHALVVEDILSLGQRAKVDEIDNVMFCMLNMLSFDEKNGMVETEQISIVLGKNFIITFQEDALKDPFNPLRDKLKMQNSKARQSSIDFLFYHMLDYIVDQYFVVMEKVGERIEQLEERIIKTTNNRDLVNINALRKEMILLKRTIAPVREVVGSVLRSDSDLLEDRTTKYFKDVYDHIVQAYDLSENYRDMIMNLQDLHLNNQNVKMNEAMKVMAIVTCLLAPATVIGGFFGMNFEQIPWLHNKLTFSIASLLMVGIPVTMILIFRRRGWF
jgi:magnesium transporter